MGKKIQLEKAYFGIKLYPMSSVEGEKEKMKTYNLFSFGSVKRSIAMYLVMPEKVSGIASSDPLYACFGEVQRRTEFEFMVCPWGWLDESDRVASVGQRVDVYEMYVEPNREHLMEIVNNISVNSAKRYLRENRRYFRR